MGFFPESLTGWVAVIGGILAIFGALVGFVLWLLDQRIDDKAERAVKVLVYEAMQPIQLQLTTMNGEIARIRSLEAKLENGLGERLNRLENRLDEIIEHMLDGTMRKAR